MNNSNTIYLIICICTVILIEVGILIYFYVKNISLVKKRWYSCNRGDHNFITIHIDNCEKNTTNHIRKLRTEKCKFCDCIKTTETFIKISRPKRYLQKVV